MNIDDKEVKVIAEIDQNDNYTLNVCAIPGVDLLCYGIINKKWGVVEMSTSVLANARKFLDMLDKWEKDPPDEGVTAGLPDFGPEAMQ